MHFGTNESYDYLNKNNLSYISGTPSQMHLIDFSRLDKLRNLTLSGEAFQKAHFEDIKRRYKGRITNAYGITEGTVYEILETFLPDSEYINSIGKPLANIRFYVLDENLRVTPIGAIGVLYLSGACLARGYLNRPEENAKRFISNPFLTKDEKASECETKLYRTGDLVRWSHLGILEYVGREDAQVN